MGGTLNAAELLLELSSLGVRLQARDDRPRYSPKSGVTAELSEQLKAHKVEVLALLRPVAAPMPARTELGLNSPKADANDRPAVIGDTSPNPAMTAEAAVAACRCGATAWRDVPIHGGQSIRRDCGGCGRFIDFPIWYGNDTLQNEM